MAKYLILDNEKVIIKGNHDDNVTVIIRTDKPDLDYQLSDGEYNILVFVDYAGDINMNERGRIDRANVKMTYFELNDHQFCINSNLDVYLDSSLQVLTIVLANSRKRFDFNLYNKEKGSTVEIANNIVCLADADLIFNCIGIIEKGAKAAKCHQKSRCLTIDDPKRAKVLPILKIDENDVEASHSLSCGTIDEDVLFYMNSRGLSKHDALNLIVNSYLLPDEDFYKKYEDGAIIRKMALRKVGFLC